MEQDTEAAVRPCVGRRDWLVPWPVAATTLGRTTKTLTDWHRKGFVPAVRMPGDPGQLMTPASWLADVLASPARGQAGSLAEVTDAWWAKHEALKAVA